MVLRNNKNMKKIEKNKLENKNWKSDSQSYLKELQLFLDKAENIQGEELRKEIIFQMLKCDKELTNLAEKMFEECYKKGKESIEDDD